MRKFLVGAAMALSFALPIAASASTNITFLTLNGGPNATIPLGATANANVQYDLTNDMTTSDTESLSWQVLDGAGNAALPPVCVDIPDRTTAGTFNASFPIGTGGQTEGTWDVRVRLYGTAGTGADNQCGGAFTNSHTFTNVLTITTPADSNNQTNNPFPGNSTGFCALFPADCVSGTTGQTGPSGFNGGFGQVGSSISIFCQLHPVLCGIPQTPPATGGTASSSNDLILQALHAILDKLNGSGTSGNAQVCTGLSAVLDGLHVGSTGIAVSNLQVFLMAHGGTINALATGHASYGFFGQQTAAALFQVQSANGCN